MRSILVSICFLPLCLHAQNVFLMGDAGEPKKPDRNLELLMEKTKDASEEDVLIFLGDNLYPKGLPGKEDPDRAEMEQKLIPQLEIMKSFPGQAYIIPGNHDWAQGRKYGWEHALNMEKFIRDYFQGEDVFLPLGGCPGPVEIPVNDYFTLIILNTQYFLHPWDKPREDSECEQKSTLEALEELKLAVQRNKGKHILIAAHHPVYTYGEHHGNFSLKQHLTPPVLGSLQPFFRRFIGNIQDNTHPKYRAIMSQVVAAMNEAEHVVYAAGHEHSLQLIEKEGHHFIVSGSGSKTTHVKQGKDSQFAKSEQGFAILDLKSSGAASVEYWGKDSGNLFSRTLYEKELSDPAEMEALPDFTDSTATVVASRKYEGKKGKDKWLGANYREVWSTPVEVDVFDVGTERGGLKILKKGGGMQTKSLRLEAEDGKQYVLRSIEKYPENAIPPALRKTFAQDIVEDQISASHPYGAFIIPTLAEAAQIYHTNPEPVLIPDDSRFGQYQNTFASTLALYEERPNKEAAGDKHFGEADDVEGTLKVLDKLKEDNDNIVDQNFVVRNRVFDMWIGDWDRHDDQWRWAEFDKGKGKLYRPIPRDRDQAFFINEGIIPYFASRKWALPKIEGFDEEVDWAPGISQNARFFDRTFMNEPDWEDWQKEIDFLQEQLTDEVIEKAVSQWPDDIQKLTADRVRTGLKARREDMERYAREQYLFLAEEVEVVGSDKHEFFLIEHLSPLETKVTVRKRKKDGELEQVIYSRTFKAEETKEIRLYGRDGEDIFEIRGNTAPKIKVRIIGGTDKDLIINSTSEKLRNTRVYDRIKSTKVEGISRGILKLSKDPAINRYDRKSFKYDVLMPLVTVAANPDDGLFLGGGFIYTKNGWRKEPFAAKHSFSGVHAVVTESFSFNYSGIFTDVFGKWDLSSDVVVQKPFFVNNFFGVGNETEFVMDLNAGGEDDDPIDYYRIRMERIEAGVDVVKNLGAYGQFTLGAGYRSIDVEETENRILSDITLPAGSLETNNYAKGKIGISVDTRENKIMPQAGMTAMASIERFEALTDISNSFTRFNAEWAFYLSARLPSRLVIANRLGFAHNEGTSEFFNLNTLGGRSNLRGYRRTRFYGETSMYHNIDLRLKLFSFRSYIFPGQFGILAFHDTGRVWVEGEESDTWHTGKGFGVWLSPLNQLVLNINYAFGEDENIPAFYMGFFF